MMLLTKHNLIRAYRRSIEGETPKGSRAYPCAREQGIWVSKGSLYTIVVEHQNVRTFEVRYCTTVLLCIPTHGHSSILKDMPTVGSGRVWAGMKTMMDSNV